MCVSKLHLASNANKVLFLLASCEIEVFSQIMGSMSTGYKLVLRVVTICEKTLPELAR